MFDSYKDPEIKLYYKLFGMFCQLGLEYKLPVYHNINRMNEIGKNNFEFGTLVPHIVNLN